MFNAVLAIGLLFTPGMARVVRSAVLNVVNLEYIDAAKLRGENALSIIVGEILPNIYPTLIVEGAVRLGHAILVSSSLGYIGLGPPPPTPDWGLMASEGRLYMLQNPWPVFAPCIAIVLSVIGVNLFGDGLKTILVAKKSSQFE
jgi:peptide/nickel transport system permease protein